MEEDRPLTKAERKALRKQEKLAQKESMNRKKVLAKVGWAMAGIMVVSLLFFWGFNRYVPIPESEKNQPVNQVMASDWILGNSNAPVMVLEYSDFQCPACKLYSPLIRQMSQEYGDKVAIVYRHFPLKQIHMQAELAAQAAEAAGKQGKFWEMNEKLFASQGDWAEKRKAKAIFIGYAKELGLDEAQFKKDLTSKEVRALVKADYMSGLQNRLNSTPSFFVNGERMATPQGEAAFREILDLKLREATAGAELKATDNSVNQ